MKKEILFASTHSLPVKEHIELGAYAKKLATLKVADAGRYATHEASLLLPIDSGVLEETKRMAERYVNPKLKFVIVIGVGGSNLGAKAVYDALRGPYDLALPTRPKLIFLDTLSGQAFAQVAAILESEVVHPGEFLINIISKSGNTAESVANFALIHEQLSRRFPDIASRVVATTDVDSALWKMAKKLGFGALPIPEKVGGRYSVFSAVGLFPLLLAGVDVDGFRSGATEMFERVTAPSSEENCAMHSAEEIFAAMKSGCAMLDIFFFHPELESLGKWERQLVAESLGKEKDLAGDVVHAGITPIVSIGSTDLHSMAQLYFGGPRDKFTVLVRADEPTTRTIPTDGPLSGLVPGLPGKSSEAIMDAIYEGVRAAYRENGLPYLEVKLPDISSYSLGAYMEWRMAAVMYLAKLMNVNPFDQPNVEDYKKVTRRMLEKRS